MLDTNTANDVIFEALSLGASFCDIFIEKNETQSFSMNSSKIKDIKSGLDFGIGIRLIFNDKSLYGYTNSVNKEELIKLTRILADQYKKKTIIENTIAFKTKKIQSVSLLPDKDVDLAQKVLRFHELDKMVRAKSEKIHQVNISLMQRKQNIEIFDSEGLHVTDFRPYCRMSSTAIAKDGNNQATGTWGPGARGGYSFAESLDLEIISERISSSALNSLKAKPCPAGVMPVVIDNGFGGVIFHEACGHSLETTSVEKKSSVFWDKKGEMIANEALSAVDDGTIDGLWGSLNCDDEGMDTQRTQLIKDGKLTNFLSDRMGEIKTGHKRTGSARRESYKYAPASRMRNTFIEPGRYSLEELLESMGDGLYAKSMGGGSVNPGTGEFNFSVQEGYLVKNGKLTDCVKGATLIGRGEEIMQHISMVGTDIDYSAGTCGSVSGGIPVTVGQPPIKVDKILVGGKA
ncbi:TldD/PmbA family protein [Sulfurimonas sp. MAG313]|nr:TldD/PmbA family protein [Sulfurimonas sp. MAG313]MDF1882052.1 TldD/PmbA family protein [Sulfurimonas sp. MAG313]